MPRPEVICPKCKYLWQPSRFWLHQLEGDLCYCCSLWPKWVRRQNDPDVVRCRGIHYTILGDFEYNYHVDRDFVYLISFFDGRVVASRNVICQGAIHGVWRAELSNNAYSVVKVPMFETLGFGNFVFDEDAPEPEPIVQAPVGVAVQPKKQLGLFSE